MNAYRIYSVFGLLTIFGLASLGVTQEPSALPKENVVLQEGIEVQTRGPLHEAFAQPIGVKPEPGVVIAKEPPPLVPEEPPEQKPEAENSQWIPGYWAWDAQKQDFLWVSGVYRIPPQDRTFVPGYWQHATDGWRWVAGFWAGANQPNVPYTPEPPAALDNGPSMPAPNEDAVYLPGSWIYRDTRFVWRPGYYSALQVGRVWVPAHYAWTPNGYLFIDGYWDYPLEDRGLAFAPVFFSRPFWNDRSWRYRPNYILNSDAFFDSAFTGPAGFYFGDYYDPLYARAGYRPWHNGSGRYDPLFAYHGARNHRGSENWAAGAGQVYGNRSSGKFARPPITLAQQTTLVNGKSGHGLVLPIVTPAKQFTSTRAKVVTATPAQLEKQRTFAQGSRVLAQNRSQFDAATPKFRAGETRSLKVPALTNAKIGSQNLAVPNEVRPRGIDMPAGTKIIQQTSPKLNAPRFDAPVQQPKIVTPRINTPTPQPKIVTPQINTPTPQPKIVTPRINTPAPQPKFVAPRINTPAPQPKFVAPRINAPAPQPKFVAPPAPRFNTPAPRINTPAPRVSAPPARQTNRTPAPAPARPANTKKR